MNVGFLCKNCYKFYEKQLKFLMKMHCSSKIVHSDFFGEYYDFTFMSLAKANGDIM